MTRLDAKMTDRQHRFLEAFTTRGRGYLCATRAAALAGYRWPGKQGPRLMTYPHIHTAVETWFQAELAQIKAAAEAKRYKPKGRQRCM